MPAIAHENKILGNVNTLNDLTDVNLTSPQNGQVLTIRNGEWVNNDPQAGDSIIYLTKAEYDALTPVENQMYGITDWSPEALALIKDGEVVANATWSSQKINTQLGLKANSADVPTKAQITNPNLLDNPWFTVNQRGKSQYVNGTDAFCLDRWHLGGGTIDVTSNGFDASLGSDTYVSIYQVFESISLFNGKTMTASVLYSDGTIKTGTAVVNTSQDTVFLPHGANLDAVDLQSSGAFRLTMYGSTTRHIRAIKLELGSISTLALDTAPNYATELLKCQRYFVRIATNPTARTNFNAMFSPLNSTDNTKRMVYIVGTLPTTMRTTPVVQSNDITKWLISSGLNNIQVVKYLQNLFCERINANNLIVVGQVEASNTEFGQYGQLWCDTANSYLDFNADL